MLDFRLEPGIQEIDYLQLMSLLNQYARPRAKISRMLKTGNLIRIKKGLYVIGRNHIPLSYSKEILANWIYGPSCISLEYALSYYGLIPERVELVTSITCKKDKNFDTPVGRFLYKYCNPKRYPVQIQRLSLSSERNILIATPEKALADMLVLTKSLVLITEKDVCEYLLAALRIDEKSILNLRKDRVIELANIYLHRHVNLFLKYVENRGQQ